VPYARAKDAAGEEALSSALYGGVAGGLTGEIEDFIKAVMSDMLDTQQSLPPLPDPL
jgi:sphinganine-1-phosphate aldolase